MQETAYSTPKPPSPRPPHHDADMDELKALRKRCAMQRKELERLKAIVTVASTSDVENVIIVKDTTTTKEDQ